MPHSPLATSEILTEVTLRMFSPSIDTAPLFIVMVVLVFIPWLMWGFAIHTERLHDRDKSAWWLLVFYVVPGLLGHFAKAAWFAGGAGMVLHYVLALASLALTIWGCDEIGCLRGTAGPNKYPSKRDPPGGSSLAEAAGGRGALPRRVPARSRVRASTIRKRGSRFSEEFMPILKVRTAARLDAS